MERYNPSELSPTRNIATQLLSELVKRNMTISLVEGCTGGILNNAITIPGSVKAFHVGLVSYSQEAKIRCGVPISVIDKNGQFSMETALSLTTHGELIRHDSLVIGTTGELSGSKPHCNVVYRLNKRVYSEVLNGSPSSKNQLKQMLAQKIFSHAYYLIGHGEIPQASHLQELFINRDEANPDAQSIVGKLAALGLKLSVMESCTGGEIASSITDVDGSSQVFDSAYITYDENMKQYFGVPFASMYEGGVYSKQVALEMAKAAMSQSQSDISIGTTGTMETIDTRPYHKGNPGTVYVAIIIRGQKPFIYQFNLHPKLSTSREQLKKEIAYKVFGILEHILDTYGESTYPPSFGKQLVTL